MMVEANFKRLSKNAAHRGKSNLINNDKTNPLTLRFWFDPSPALPILNPNQMPDSTHSDAPKPGASPHESLHAYWRMPYILAPKSDSQPSNPFTQLPDQDDAESFILLRGDHNYTVLNRYPYNAGHLLVVPYREVAALSELTAGERHEHIDAVTEAQALLTRALKPDGFNTGYNFGSAAGAGIPRHLHCHIVPRWNGDTNFMPVIGNTRVLPDALQSMWERLRKYC
jgi:ATP adenylyltransferase